MKPENHTIEELEQYIDNLGLQINPPSGPPDYIDTSIGEDQVLDKKNTIKLIKKEIEKRLKK